MPNAPTPSGVRARPRLGELLLHAGCITREQLELALRDQSSWGGRLGENLLHDGLIDEHVLAYAIGRQLHLPVVNLDREPPPPEILRLVPLSIAERYGLVAVALDRAHGRILVACVDPTNLDAMRDVRQATRLVPQPCVATASQVDRVVRRHYYGEAEPVTSTDPRLDVSRRTIASDRDPDDRLGGLARSVDSLVDLLRRDPGSH
jgi:hypothetical protein